MSIVEQHDRDAEQFRDAALAIGRRLCRDAIRNADHCTWTGATVIDFAKQPLRSVVMPLAGDLYGGSAGIAMFLAQLHSVAPEQQFAETAAGALRHALAWCADAPPVAAFTGALGVAYAIEKTQSILNFTEAGEAKVRLVAQAGAGLESQATPVVLDFLNGAAGGILALLALKDVSGAPTRLALRLGEEICSRADWYDDHCEWDTRDACAFDALPLSGLSHGASGMAMALLRLYAITGQEDFLRTARGAYAYEDTLFVPELGNWLDLRFVDSVGEAIEKQRVIPAWCHGAPGIALSRLLAASIDRDQADIHRAVFATALDTTIRALDDRRALRGFDATPCHGIGGLADILAIAGGSGLQERARQAMRDVVTSYGADLNYPSGVADGGESPSLFLGNAGVGYALLRLCDPGTIPSVLILE